MIRSGSRVIFGLAVVIAPCSIITSKVAGQTAAPVNSHSALNGTAAINRFVDMYCVACHNVEEKTAGLALEQLSSEDVSQNAATWEKVVRKLVARQMPPDGRGAPAGSRVRLDRLAARRFARPCGRHRARSRPDRRRSGGLPAPNTRTPFATFWRSISTPRRCCRRTSQASGSTT